MALVDGAAYERAMAEVARLTAENERLHFDYERLAERKPAEVADISREDSPDPLPTSPSGAINRSFMSLEEVIGAQDDEIEVLKDEIVELRGWKDFGRDIADVLARMCVGWEQQTGIDLAQHPDVQRVMARFRAMMGR